MSRERKGRDPVDQRRKADDRRDQTDGGREGQSLREDLRPEQEREGMKKEEDGRQGEEENREEDRRGEKDTIRRS